MDLCAGNGAVGLFASTRTEAQIIGVEIQERLADMASALDCPQWLEPANVHDHR